MAEGAQPHPAGGDGRRWLAAAPPNLRAKVVEKILNILCQVQVQGSQPDQLHAVASRYEAMVFSNSDNVQDYLRTISIKMMMIKNNWQPVAQPAASESHQPHMGGQMRPPNAVPVPAAAVPPQASPASTTRLPVRPPQAQNMQISHKPSQKHPMAPVAQLHPCYPTAAAQIQTRHNSSGMWTQQPVEQAAFNHQAHMPLNAETQTQTAVPRTTSTNRLPPTDQVQNMGINPMAPTVQLHPCHPTPVAQVQTQSMARHNSSGMCTQPPQIHTQQPHTKLARVDQQNYVRVNQQQSYQAHGGQQSNVAAPLQIGHSGERNNQQSGRPPVEVDWREDMFQRITSLKRAHFSELVELQRALRARVPQLESLPKEQADKYHKVVDAMGKIGAGLSFLQLQKSSIPEAMKDQFDKHQAVLYGIVRWCRQINKLHNAGKNDGRQLQLQLQNRREPSPPHVQQKHQEQPAAETSFSQFSENVPVGSPLVQQQENNHHMAGEEAADDKVRREAEPPVATNLTGGSTPPLPGGSGTCSEEKKQEHHPAYEAIPQLTQNVNPVETPLAQQQTNRSLSPEALRSLAHEMGVNLKRAFRHMTTPSCSMDDDGNCAWSDESSEESCNKRRRTHDGALHDEITAAYSMLVETEIRITDDDAGGADGAAVIELCYVPALLTPDLRAVIDPSEMSTKLLVPADYPQSSPVLLGDDGERRKAGIAAGVLDVEFRRALGQLPEPRSIEGMAKAWDACVRRAVVQFAHGLGGGTLSTRHGRWESCIGA